MMKTFESGFESGDGIQFFIRGWEPEHAPRAVIALVHGLGEHTGRYHHVGEAFTKTGYALMGLDLRGHGRSGGIRGHTPSMEAYMLDIDSLIERARVRYPNLPVFLYGHSLGGILTLNYCLRRKPDLKGVIVTSPALHSSLENQPVKVMLAKVLGTLMPTVTLSNGLDPATLSHDREVVEAYAKDPLVHDKASLGWGKTMLQANRWALEHASEFPLPLLLMHGKADMLAFPSSSMEFAAGLKDKCTLVLWDDLYHETHNELRKAEVLDAIVDALRSCHAFGNRRQCRLDLGERLAFS